MAQLQDYFSKVLRSLLINFGGIYSRRDRGRRETRIGGEILDFFNSGV